jgi:hypothetical protein
VCVRAVRVRVAVQRERISAVRARFRHGVDAVRRSNRQQLADEAGSDSQAPPARTSRGAAREAGVGATAAKYVERAALAGLTIDSQSCGDGDHDDGGGGGAADASSPSPAVGSGGTAGESKRAS